LQYIVSDCIHGRALHSTNYMFCKTTMICLQQLRRESFVVYSVHSSDFLQRLFYWFGFFMAIDAKNKCIFFWETIKGLALIQLL